MEEELILRYNEALKRGIPNPYNKDKDEWEAETKAKIKELEKISHPN